MKRHRYTPEEARFIESNIVGRRYAELVELFNRKFDNPITIDRLTRYASNHGLKNMMSGKVPIGSEFKDGPYIMVKVAEPDVWKRKQIMIWEAANGPVPKGHHVIFADRNRSNFNLDNLLLVSKRELVFMNNRGLIFADAELTKTGKQIADVYLLISDLSKKKLKGGTA